MRLRTLPLVLATSSLLWAATGSPMLRLLPRFTAAGVPAQGPAEQPVDRSWTTPTSDPASPAPALPGAGLSQHPMLYAGEGYNNLLLVSGGKVIWNYSTGPKGELDDVWLLSNGHVLYARQFSIEEVTPQKQIVWHYDAPAGTEIHTCQPIGLNRVLFIENGLPPRLMIVDKRTNRIETQHDLPAESLTDARTVHPQFRRVRITARGTYLVPFLRMHRVAEYDKNFREIWSYDIPTPWAAIRLRNGNTLITDEHDKLVREVSPDKRTVWEFSPADLPAGIVLHNTQTAERLANGDTVIFSSTGGTTRDNRTSSIQAIEVTPAKKVVWVLQDWKDLGPATTAQFLDQPGTPEKPGSLQR
jgi:hypothetical protein